MIEPSRRHGHFDTRWNRNGSSADAKNKSAAANGGATGVSKDVRRRSGRPQAVVAAETSDGGAPLQRWEEEGGHYALDNGPDLEADGGECAPAGLDWAEFLTRRFPGRRRHDLKALKAYEAYRSDGVKVGVFHAGPQLAGSERLTRGANHEEKSEAHS